MSLNNHHAHLVIRAWDKEALVTELLSNLGVEAENNPDLVIHEGPLGIDEARLIGRRVSTKPFGETRVIIIDASAATKQAQNALLKTLEEPGEGNRFFLVAPYEDILLPTLRSRLELHRSDTSHESDTSYKSDMGAEAFLKLSLTKRLDFAKKFHESEASLGAFLDALLVHLRSIKAPAQNIERVFTVRRYADDTSVDRHLILQHLALVL